MRIIAGEFRSRILKGLPGNATRPTTDRVKEAIFSRLGPYFDKGVILDLFSGSGSISLEALSRGFDRAFLVDKSKQACKVIEENVNSLGVKERVEIWNCDYQTALNKMVEKVDLIYLDPPYDFERLTDLLNKIVELDILKDNSTIVVETHKQTSFAVEKPLYVEKSASYGISKVTYIRKE